MNFQEYLNEIGYSDNPQEEFQNFLKNKNNVTFPKYGNTKRGMDNVNSFLKSAPLDNSLNSQFTEQIYFMDSHTADYNSVKTVTDVGSDPEEMKIKSEEFYYYPNSENKKFAFGVKIYTSKSAKKLEEAYKVTKPGTKEILFFIEDNTGDKTDFTFGAVRVGEYVQESLLSTYDAHVKKNESLKDFLIKAFKENTGQDIDRGFVDELLRFGKAQYPLLRGISGVYKVVDFITFGAFTQFTMDGLSNLLEVAIEYVNKVKISEESWNPDAEKGFSPLFYPKEAEKAFDNIDDDALNKQVQSIVRRYSDDLKAIDKYIVDKLKIDNLRSKNNGILGVNDIVYSAFSSVHTKCLNIINDLGNFDLSEILKTGIRSINAFACGIWNSLVDTIASLLGMIKMIVDTSITYKTLMKNLETQLPKLIERIEEALQAWEKIDFKQCVLHFIQKTLESNLTISIVKVAYYLGCFYGFIISVIIEVIIGIVISGGALSVEEVARRVFQELFGLISGITKDAKKAFDFTRKLTAKSFAKMVEGLDALIELMEKGTAGIMKLIDEMYEIGSRLKEFIIEAYQKLFNTNARKKLESLGLHPTRYEKGVFDLCPIS
ncbi:hypothetical protein SAMN05421841_2860 [Chryseobacterium wanjuense]|uniref:Uncharacterized protein n=1 Tax=Chryseobacterium wanjuense TaxID=356305 RepID=A0A1I0RKS8_9FLAO|nr:hypothetical protein [Chryseobacterium wanjuense]SEW41715.1 hypothetical protein SAMN05421841_2860 [Chryseobacterium wanjuense]